MTTRQIFNGRQNMISSNSADLKIMLAYLASHLTAMVVLGFFFAIGLFDGSILSGNSLLMQLFN